MKCPFGLHKYCIIITNKEAYKVKHEFLDDEFIKLYCSMCIKSMYARAKARISRKTYVVVNTL